MIVYFEYAFLENFLLDGLLLYLALRFSRAKLRLLALIAAAALGGAEGVLIPLVPLPAALSYLVKILGGVLLCVVAVSKGSLKTYAVTAAAFFFLTFALGGLLTAVYSFFEIAYMEGGGYLVESAPVAFVLAASGIFAVACGRGVGLLFRFRREKSRLVLLSVTEGGKTVHWKGLYDSGNLITFHGNPVCVTSALGIFAIFGRNPVAVGRMRFSTVNGSRSAPVFCCEKMELTFGGKTIKKRKVFFTVGELNSKEYQVIIHTALLEEDYENTQRTERLAAEDKGRERCSLSVRERGASASANGRRGGSSPR